MLDTESADCMEVSDMIKNLDSIKVSYSRVDLGGVVRKCGSSIEFTGKAYDAILAHYAENYLHSKGVFAVYIADNNWNYSKAWECPLDFATLQYDANVVTIGCVDNSVAAIIKANKKSKYEFDVSLSWLRVPRRRESRLPIWYLLRMWRWQTTITIASISHTSESRQTISEVSR